MSLFEQIKSDLDIFLSTDDFAEAHLISGQSIVCMIDSDVLNQHSGTEEFAVNESDIIIYTKTTLLEENGIERQGYGSSLNVDGNLYTVITWTENKGISQISLSAKGTY